MNDANHSKPFIFNKKLDADSLHSLYGDDYVYIEEVFGTVLSEYGLLADNIHSCYNNKNIPGLKAAVHKIKPIFGFVGLIDVQQQCQQFEQICQHTDSFDFIANDFGPLQQNLVTSMDLIKEEKRKLELFNSQKS